jgi:adenylosuccinate synthase
VYGVAKAYETYVGADSFEPNDPIFSKIRELGGEFGATTGRPRQCNWLNIDELVKAAEMNGVDEVIFNKVDILEQVGVWKVRTSSDVSTEEISDRETFVNTYPNRESFQAAITAFLCYVHPCKVRFSSNPYDLG